MHKLTKVNVDLKLPGVGGISGTWEPDRREREAAWEMYVELITRVAVVEMEPDECVLREALTSFYSLFDTTRKILRKYGPGVAVPRRKREISFGYLAVTVLNAVIRPLLCKWHPLLLDYEGTRDASVPPLQHERNWDKSEELWHEIAVARTAIRMYAELLAEVAGVPSLIDGCRSQASG